MVVDDDQRMADRQQPIEAFEKAADVRRMQPRRGFQQKNHATGLAMDRELGGELEPLPLAGRQRFERLPESEMIEADIDQPCRSFFSSDRCVRKKRNASRTVRSSTSEMSSPHLDLERLLPKPPAQAPRTRHADIGQEPHVDAPAPLPFAFSAAAARLIEAERPRPVVADLRVGRLGENVADLVERLHERGRVAPRGPGQRRPIEKDDVLHPRPAEDAPCVRPGVGSSSRTNRAPAGPADAGDDADDAERHRDIADRDLSLALAPGCGPGGFFRKQILARERRLDLCLAGGPW